MKSTKLIILLAAALFVTGTAGAQIRIAPALGLNMANLSGDIENTAMKMGFHIGGLVDISISDNFSVEPGLLYSLKGAQDADESDIKINLSYLEIPIMAKYKMESGLNLFAGPYLGMLMSAKSEPDGTDIKDFMESTDFGLKLGLGFMMESGLAFSANYGLGMSNIFKDIGDDSVTNTVIGITIAYYLGGD